MLPRLQSQLLMILLIPLLLLWPSRTQALCYVPDGSISNDVSCDPTATHSICCEQGFYCTASHLCLKSGHANASDLAFDNVYIRGTCTDPTWQAPECGGNCVKGNPDGGENVQYCGAGKFCCGEGPTCCTGGPILDLGEPSIYATAGIYSTAITFASSSTLLPSSSSSTPLISAASPQLSNGAGNDDNRKVLIVGISVGASLGVLLIAVVLGALWWIRKTRRAIRKPKSLVISNPSRPYELDGAGWRAEMMMPEKSLGLLPKDYVAGRIEME